MSSHQSISELIGGTPLLYLNSYTAKLKLQAKIAGKLEYLNPTGSVKDRLAKALIFDAEARGILKEGSTIIEPTSGNTGIGLAAIAASKGYRCILTMPETMTLERRNILKAYGAEVVLTEGSLGMKGAIARADELAASIEGSFIPGQFTSPVNGTMHETSTAPEVWKDTEGAVDIVIAGVGTGGTISGLSSTLRKLKPNIQVIAVEPADSPILSGGSPGPHRIQGIGAGFVPTTLDTSSYDEVIGVSNEDAFATGRALAQSEGVLCGVSSGAALHAATLVAQRPENAGKLIVVILPDSADRYYSTDLFLS